MTTGMDPGFSRRRACSKMKKKVKSPSDMQPDSEHGFQLDFKYALMQTTRQRKSLSPLLQNLLIVLPASSTLPVRLLHAEYKRAHVLYMFSHCTLRSRMYMYCTNASIVAVVPNGPVCIVACTHTCGTKCTKLCRMASFRGDNSVHIPHPPRSISGYN